MISPDRTVASATSTAASGTQVMGDQSANFQMSQNRVPLRVAVLGSTGSIGKNTLEVIAASDGRFEVHLLCGHRSVDVLVEQARIHRPRWVVVTDPKAAAAIGSGVFPEGTELVIGPERLEELLAGPEVDRVVSAIVGAAGLRSTWSALAAGKTVALANKETLVTAGPLVT